MRLVFAFLIAVSALCGQVVEGTVVSSVTGLPITGVNVTIEATGKTPYQTTTNQQGIFRIEGVTPGYYKANYFKTNFLPVESDAPERRPFSVSSWNDVRLQAKLTP